MSVLVVRCSIAGSSAKIRTIYIAKVATSASEKLFNGFTGSTFFHLVPIHSIHLVKFYSFTNLRRHAAIRSIMQLWYLYLILLLSGRFARCSSSSFAITIVKTETFNRHETGDRRNDFPSLYRKYENSTV